MKGQHRGGSRRFVIIGILAAVGWGRPVAAAEHDLPSGTVTLDVAVAAALAHSPALAAYGHEVDAREGRAIQAGLPPNPSLSTEVENFGRFGGDQQDAEGTQTTVSLSQVLELGGKRRERATVARLDGRLASWDYERARAEVTAATTKAFVAAVIARERLRLAERAAELARASRAAVGRQVEAGVASPAESARAEAALARADAERARHERERDTAYRALAAEWGGATVSFADVAGSIDRLAEPRPLAELATGLATNPDLARFATGRERAASAIALAERERIPDLTVRVGARRFVSAETNAFVAELSVPLPVFDRNQGAVLEAHSLAAKVRAEEDAAALAARLALGRVYEELRAACTEAGTLRRSVLPRTASALAETRRGYDQGVLRYLDVLEAERAVTQSEEGYLDAVARHQSAAAEITRLTGERATREITEGGASCDGR